MRFDLVHVKQASAQFPKTNYVYSRASRK